MKETVLVTGSSGLIGYRAAERLDEPFDVVGFDREGPPHPPPAAECVAVDLTSEESVRHGLEGVRQRHGERIASVIHLAAYYSFSGEPSPLYEEITVRSTERLLRGLRSFQVEQFVFSSTMLVHAPCEPGQRIDEAWPLEPKWAYPKSKVETEALIRAERGDIPVMLLRIAGVYDARCHSIPLAQQIQRIYERRLISHFFPGDLRHGQSFLHLEDLVDALVLLTQRRAALPPELALLLGEPETLSYEALQQEFGRLIHGKPWKTYSIPKPLAKAGAWLLSVMPLGGESFIKPWMIDLADDHYALDITLARTLLDWDPRRSLRGTLPKMVAALKADPLRWYRENKLEPPRWLASRASGSFTPGYASGAPSGRSAPEGQRRLAGGETPGSPGGRGDNTHPRLPPRSDQGLGGRNDPAGATGEHAGRVSATHGEAMSGHEGMGHDPDEMMRAQQERTLWTYFVNTLLGVWLITSPATLGYRSAGLAWSDLISGILIVLFGVLSLFPRGDFVGRWMVCFAGIWLLFAPLVFWAPTAAEYLNDTLIGALVIALSVLIPMMPGKAHHMMMMQPGPDIPPGWSYNPSTWWQRGPIIALAFVGFFISRYLAAYQLGHIPAAWDPFFGEGTQRVLTSKVSRAWPISDAGLGAVSYMLEALSGFMGGVNRWRTMPWMVTMFGLLVVPLGAKSIVLVIMQPVMVGAWCTLCLIAAVAMLVMVPLAVDEVVAMGQFLAQSVREGKPFWRTFWVGGTIEGGSPDTRSPRFPSPPAETVPAMLWGVNLPWNLLVSGAVGVWLMAAPAVFGTRGAAANGDYLVGAVVATVAAIAAAEVCRAGRFLNALLGVWLIVAPWLLGGAGLAARVNDSVAGLALILLSFPLGPVREAYGSWDRFVVWPSARGRAPAPRRRRGSAAG